MDETKPLLPPESDTSVKIRTWRHHLLLLTIILISLASGGLMYLSSEWLQYTLTKNTLGNTTFLSNFSACHDTRNNSDRNYQLYVYVQHETARWQVYATLGVSGTALFSNMILPSYTDTLGRKFLIGASILGLLTKYTMWLVVMYFKLDFIYIVLGNILEGLTGSFYGLQSAAYAYVADITQTRKDRTMAIAVIDGTMMICITVASLLTGIFIKHFHYILPMLTVVVLCALSFITACTLPETVVRRNDQTPPTMTQNVRRITHFYTSSSLQDKRCAYFTLLLAFFLFNISSCQRSIIETTYQLGKPLCWQSTTIGYFSALRHVGVIGIGSIRLFQKCFSDGIIAMGSSLFNAASFILEAFSTTDIMMFIVPVVGAFAFLIEPVILSMMSVMTPPDAQGAMFAGIAIMETLGDLVTALVGNNIYAATVSFMSGLVFLVMAGLNILVFILLGAYVLTNRTRDLSATQLN